MWVYDLYSHVKIGPIKIKKSVCFHLTKQCSNLYQGRHENSQKNLNGQF